ncbi:MAG: hypothetical protein J6X94_07255 [Lachnospiraceae bacterium]|nr:hypothetical protein [Lachnospiraceae bacterium]
MNAMGLILKIVIILLGAFLLGDAIFSLAKRRMTESFCLMWGLISVITIIVGIIIQPSKLSDFLSPMSFALILMTLYPLLHIALFFSHTISDLVRKNNELAINVSLLISENEELKKMIEEIKDGK